jgi:hypothetical protein
LRTLHINVSEFVARIGMRHFEASEVTKALQPFVRGQQKRLSFGPRESNYRGRYFELSYMALATALNVDPKHCISETTKERKDRSQ